MATLATLRDSYLSRKSTIKSGGKPPYRAAPVAWAREYGARARDWRTPMAVPKVARLITVSFDSSRKLPHRKARDANRHPGLGRFGNPSVLTDSSCRHSLGENREKRLGSDSHWHL